MDNYLALESLSHEDFAAKKVSFDDSNSTKSDTKDIEKIENILDLSRDTLAGKEFFASKMECTECERSLTFYDFIFTALVEQWHSPSFIVHTLVGNKYFVNKPRPVRCSCCGGTVKGEVGTKGLGYDTGRYGCSIWIK